MKNNYMDSLYIKKISGVYSRQEHIILETEP